MACLAQRLQMRPHRSQRLPVTLIVLRQEVVRLSQVIALLIGIHDVVVVLAPLQF